MGSTNNPINDFFLDFHHMCLMLHCYCKEKSCLSHSSEFKIHHKIVLQFRELYFIQCFVTILTKMINLSGLISVTVH